MEFVRVGSVDGKWGMKCVNEWRGTAGLKASNPYKTSQSIPLAPQRRVKAAGATPIASASERREVDVRQYFRSSARGKHKLLLFPSCLRTRRECPAVQVMTQASPLQLPIQPPCTGPTKRPTAQIKARRAGQQHPRLFLGSVFRQPYCQPFA